MSLDRRVLLETIGDLAEHDVARRVAVDVVHRLEAVEVEQQHGKVAVAPFDAAQRVRDRRIEDPPVGEPRQGIVLGLVADNRLGVAEVADIRDAADENPLA